MENNNNGGLPVSEPVNNTDNSSQVANEQSSNITKAPEPVEVKTPISDAVNKEVNPEARQEAESANKEVKKPNGLLKAEENKENKKEDVKNDFGDDWKQKMAGNDEKLLKIIDKFKTPQEALIAYKELQVQFSKTRPIPELPKDATPEQIKEYREAVGIPESWDKYDINLGDGIVINEYDKPTVDAFLKEAHQMNLKPSEVKNSLQAYFKMANEKNAELIKQAELQTAEVEKQLQKEWGNTYKDNLSMISNHLAKEIGGDEVEKLNSAVLPDGTLLINNPKLLNYLLKDAKANNMSHTITPNTQQYSSMLDRKAEIERIRMEAPNAFYNNNELSKEYKQIVDALRNQNS